MSLPSCHTLKQNESQSRGGGGLTCTHNKRGCAILTRKVTPKNPGTYLKLRPKNLAAYPKLRPKNLGT